MLKSTDLPQTEIEYPTSDREPMAETDAHMKLPKGEWQIHSEILGLTLHTEGENLRLFDTQTNRYLLMPDEESAARRVAELRVREAEQRAAEAEAEIARLEALLDRLKKD